MSETSALRVVFETRLNEPLVQCPCCIEKERAGCWSCDGCGWDDASAWDWDLTVAEQVGEWGGSDAAVDKVRHLTIEAPLWLDTATGQRKPGVAVPRTDCVCHDDAHPCRGCGRIIPESVELCIFCAEAGASPRRSSEAAFGCAPDTATLLAKIEELEAERAEDKGRLEVWIADCTRERIRAQALEHRLSQVLKTHAAFLAALRDAERLLSPEEAP